MPAPLGCPAPGAAKPRTALDLLDGTLYVHYEAHLAEFATTVGGLLGWLAGVPVGAGR